MVAETIRSRGSDSEIAHPRVAELIDVKTFPRPPLDLHVLGLDPEFAEKLVDRPRADARTFLPATERQFFVFVEKLSQAFAADRERGLIIRPHLPDAPEQLDSHRVVVINASVRDVLCS